MPIDDIKRRTVRGGMVTLVAQAMKLFLRTGSIVVMARLLLPQDFGLIGMVTGVTGVLGLFKEAGLSAVTVQRASISSEQLSTLFWLNIAVGSILCGICLIMAPAMVAFFGDNRLYWVTMALSTSFVLDAASVQHQALLKRQLRYTAMAAIDIISLLISIAVGIVMALSGFSYWALIGSSLALSAALLACVWFATKWIPGLPHRNVGARSMIHFGGMVTLNMLVGYIAYNLDKVLLGRFWGAEALGYYGKAYQLVSLPTDQLNSAIGGVAFPALSRIQDDPSRLANYFLKGYSLILGLTIPITIACGLFAEDLIFVVLGPKWEDAIQIFRLFAPTIIAFAFINPFGWLLYSTGKVVRSLKISLAIAPSLIAAYFAGMPYGPTGMASGFSIVMLVWIVPAIAWAKHGSALSSRDIIRAVKPSLLSGIIAGVFVFAAQTYLFRQLIPYQRFALETFLLFAVYIYVLLYIMKQKELIFGLLKEFRPRSLP
jgi:O-antigen/teichoic acid export membrane protein